MDVMAYSYDARATLAKISRELGNGKEDFWQKQAEEVRERLAASCGIPIATRASTATEQANPSTNSFTTTFARCITAFFRSGWPTSSSSITC